MRLNVLFENLDDRDEFKHDCTVCTILSGDLIPDGFHEDHHAAWHRADGIYGDTFISELTKLGWVKQGQYWVRNPLKEDLDDKDAFGMSDETFGHLVRNIGPAGGYISFSEVALYIDPLEGLSYRDFINAFRARGWTIEEIKRDQWWTKPPPKVR